MQIFHSDDGFPVIVRVIEKNWKIVKRGDKSYDWGVAGNVLRNCIIFMNIRRFEPWKLENLSYHDIVY